MSEGDPTPEPAAAGPIVPRLPPVFDAATLRRLGAEFVIIVVGVLVAFAVEDWQAGRERQDEALRLLSAMEVDVAESVADLREARTSAVVRQSAIVEILRRVGAPLPPADEWTPLDEVSLDGLTGIGVGGLDIAAPFDMRDLLILVTYAQVFDARTVAYDEFRATGALASLPSRARADIAAFYGRMLDFAESNQFIRDQGRALEDALEAAGVAARDWLPEAELIRRIQANPRAQASLRRAYMRAQDQLTMLPIVAERLETEGAAMLEGARAEL